jgi:hypothetical protein
MKWLGMVVHAYNTSYLGNWGRSVSPHKVTATLCQKKEEGDWGTAQVAEFLPSICEALSSIPSAI